MRPRVLLVGPTPPPLHGGSVITRNLLASRLSEAFELVHTDTSDRRSLANLGSLDLRNIVLAAVHGLRFAAALVRERPALAHVPVAQNRLGFLRDCLFLLPAHLLRVPVVVHLNGGYCRFFTDAGPITRRLSRQTLGRAYRVLVLGERLRDELAGIVAGERVAVVPYGVPDIERAPAAGSRPPAAIPAEPTTEPDRVQEAVRVLYLGTLNRTKGFLDVLAAAELIADSGDPVEFLFAGGFASQADARLARPYRDRLGGRARFPGVVDGPDKARALHEADIFVFPSFYRFEGQPLVILEAMAAGLPVVSTDHGVIAETVAHGETGYLVPPRDPAALAERILELAADPALRSRLGAAGRARFLERHTLAAWADRIGGIWREAAGLESGLEAAAA